MVPLSSVTHVSLRKDLGFQYTSIGTNRREYRTYKERYNSLLEHWRSGQ